MFTYSVVELALIIFLYLQRKKVVINIHDPQSLGNSSNKIVKYVIQKILKTKNFSITTHTKYAQSIIQGQFSNKDCQIMPHSDIDIFYNNNSNMIESKQTLNLDENTKYILFFGTIKKTKGLDILLDAWSLINESFENYKLLIVGKEWQNNEFNYRKMIAKNGLQKSVLWIDERVQDTEVSLYFNASEVVVLPYTRIYSSGVLFRAMGYGNVVIASDQKAFLEIIDDESAFIFKSGSVDSLKEVLEKSLTNKYLYEKIKTKSNTLINSLYNWDRIGYNMCQYFQKEIKKNNYTISDNTSFDQ